MNETILSSFNDKCTLLEVIKNIQYPYLHDVRLTTSLFGTLHVYVYTSSKSKFDYTQLINWLKSNNITTFATGYSNIKFDAINNIFTSDNTIKQANAIYVENDSIMLNSTQLSIADNRFTHTPNTLELTQNTTSVEDFVYRVV